MGRRAHAVFLVAALAMGTLRVSAQEKPKSEDVAMEARLTETTQLKISVTFTEFEGDKKVKTIDQRLSLVEKCVDDTLRGQLVQAPQR